MPEEIVSTLRSMSSSEYIFQQIESRVVERRVSKAVLCSQHPTPKIKNHYTTNRGDTQRLQIMSV